MVQLVLYELLSSSKWKKYFIGFEFPYGFLGIDEYKELLLESGFCIKRVELIPKDMIQDGESGLEGCIRTTWLPYTVQIPEEKRDMFIKDISSNYLSKIPLDKEGKVHVAMVRIEVEAEKVQSEVRPYYFLRFTTKFTTAKIVIKTTIINDAAFKIGVELNLILEYRLTGKVASEPIAGFK